MKKYKGVHICPYCNKEFPWEFIDDGYRRGMPSYTTEPIAFNDDPSIAKCNIARTRNPDFKALNCYCPHCQAFVEILDIDDIPKELFS